MDPHGSWAADHLLVFCYCCCLPLVLAAVSPEVGVNSLEKEIGSILKLFCKLYLLFNKAETSLSLNTWEIT